MMLRFNAHPRRRSEMMATLSAIILFWCLLSLNHPMKGGVSSVAAHSASTSFSTGKTKTTTEDSTTTTKATSYSTLSYDVIDLTSANFAATVNDGNVWLIEFYTSWCSHCQNFKASYENVALTFHSSPQEKIRVAKVDCSVEKALATRFGVRGYPSFYLVSGWTVYEFEDDRSETNLISFARGGYKRQDPIPWVSSPMGPMGILQGALIFVGMTIMGFLDILQTRFGIHPILAGLGICVIGIVGGMISIVLLTILSTPREKVE